jgi:Ca2+-binding EF-hand superfamily protein
MRRILVIGLIALSTSGCAMIARNAVAAATRPDPGKMLADADTDGDGRITRAEFTAARAKLFVKLDRNADGYLDKQDVPQRFLARRNSDSGDRLQEAMVMLDKNGDGRISRDEFVNGPGLLFERADTNHDGVVDAKELAAFRATIAARRAQ